MERRRFLQNIGATAVGFSLLKSSMAGQMAASAGAVGKVVVVGGGMAGTSVAKYLRFWGGTGMDVTLVEPNATYISNIFSNMVLTGERSLSQLSFNYSTLKSKYGVKVQNFSVTGIDPIAKQVKLSSGTTLPYDRLVLAPGIDFETLPSLTGTTANQAKIVHAWKAGAQTTSLKNQIQAMTKSDTFILTIPPAPYRCPPGPYERACVVADYLKTTKGGGKVIVLDANAKILAEPLNFTKAFNETHKGIITYIPNAPVTSINADTMTVVSTAGTFQGKVINAIPIHKAGDIIFKVNGLANNAMINGRVGSENKWATVNVLSYESTAIPGIHIIGDSSSTTQPKAGHIANAEAKVCADAIIQIFKGGTITAIPMTNSSCFTPITKTTASWLTAIYRYDPASKTMKINDNGGLPTESNGATSENYEDMLKWFNNLMADTFS